MRTGGIILCGGQSKRMGTPKAWLPIGGRTLLEHVVEIASRAVWPIVVVAAPDQEVPPLPVGVLLARDRQAFQGPLQGLATGMAALPSDIEAAYLSSCDAPLLRTAFIRRMIELLGQDATCVPNVDGHLHPLAAVFRVAVRHHVEELLAAGRLRPLFLFDLLPTRIVGREELVDVDPNLDSLRNVNTPDEFEAALKLAISLDDARPAPQTND